MKYFTLLFTAIIALSACSTESITGGTYTPPSDTLTVTAPAQGAVLMVPFTLSGAAGGAIADVQVKTGTVTKSAVIAGSGWSAVIGTNEISLGNIQITINGKDSGGTIIKTVEIFVSVTNNGTAAYLVELSGTLISNFTSQWKVYADNGVKEFIGTVDPLSGAFVIPIESNIGIVKLLAFRDDSANNIFDAGEPVSGDQPQVTVGATNMSGLEIVIPLILNYTVSGTFSGNIYHLPMGVAVFNNDSLDVLTSAPSTASNFSYSLTFQAAEFNEIKVYYYIDDNGDQDWNYVNANPFNLDAESSCLVYEFGLITQTNTVDIALTGKVINGTLSGDFTGFNRIQASFTSGEIYSAVSAGNYSMKFYLATNSSAVNIADGGLFCFIDADNDKLWQSSESMVSYTNAISLGNGSAVTTNTADFVIKKFTVSAGILGDDASKFTLQYKDDWKNETQPVASYVWNSYVFGDVTNAVTLSAFRDYNADTIPDPENEPVFTYSFVLSNITTLSTNFNLKRTIASIVTNGAVSPTYVYPMIFFGIGATKVYHALGNVTLTNYWNVNSGVYLGTVYAFNDANNDGKRGGGEPIISLNTITLSNYVSVTNLTLIF
ncbi:MAG: hypothetical protein A2014_01800 [Spirochaetes bacterium GWF1_49_6]|nr:MAG: hypothetical protein A2014_01800 [Spirochaetes bacterium GWF1_49_6]